MTYLSEEHVEDAVVAYLQGVLPSGLNVFAAFARTKATFPCVMVAAVSNDSANDALNWNDQRLMRVECHLLVEVKKRSSFFGSVDFRDDNKALRKELVKALAADDARDEIQAFGGLNVRQMLIGEITRSPNDPRMETIVPVEMLVVPTTDLEE